MTSIIDFTSEQLADLDQEALIAITLELRAIIARQEAQIQEQAAQIQELQDQLAKNSKNSGKPPSSDGLKKARVRSLREKGKRRNGGQKGHKGHTLEMVECPDNIVLHSVEVCPHCQTDLKEIETTEVEKRQVFDVPPVQIEVTEHQAEIKCCPNCKHLVKGTFPEEVGQPTQYGQRLKAQAVYLNNYQLLPLSRIGELFEDFYGHSTSQAFVLTANETFVKKAEPSLISIKEQLIAADVLNCDESGIRVEGRLNWLHVAGTEQLTYYAIHRKRGQEAMRAIGILPEFGGRSVHDGWSSYFTFKNCSHALCNTHHLRELQFIVDQYGQQWADDMGKLLLDIKAEVEASPSDWTALPPDRIEYFEKRYDELLGVGFAANPPPDPPPVKKRGRKKQTPPKNLLDHLQKYKAETLVFMYDFRVPFDNNLAERDVRMIKVKQKISGTFRTRNGADTFCAIRSYISTARKQGHNVIQTIYDAFSGQPFVPSAAQKAPE